MTLRVRTRLAAYGVVIESGRILLALVADGYPGAGNWTLPGGGVEIGEQPSDGAVREVYEEAGLVGKIERLLDVSTRVFADDQVDGYDTFHWIRVLYIMRASGDPRVIELNGSTADARWYDLADVPALPTVEIVGHALTLLDQA